MTTPFPAQSRSAIVQAMPCRHLTLNFAEVAAPPPSLELFQEATALWPTLAPLEAFYPGFREWYWGKVVPGLEIGSRRIVRIGSIDSPSGIAIAKRDARENKICTVWVADEVRGRGLGRLLLEEAVEWVGDASPLFTVPAERFDEFQPLVKRLGFEQTSQVPSLYRPGKVEHIYNGRLYKNLSS